MAEIIEKRMVNDYIECTMALGSASLYIPRGIFNRTWFMKKSDGTVMECRIKEFGHCLVNEDDKKPEKRNCVRYETPEGSFVHYAKYGRFYLYDSYDDAVRGRVSAEPCIYYDVDYDKRIRYDIVSVIGMFKEMGFTKFEFTGTWNNLLKVRGYYYKNGNLYTALIQSTMWVDKDGLHIEPIIPKGVYKTAEDAYASNMPKLVTFADVDDEEEQNEKDKRIAELEEIIRYAQNELNKINAL